MKKPDGHIDRQSFHLPETGLFELWERSIPWESYSLDGSLHSQHSPAQSSDPSQPAEEQSVAGAGHQEARFLHRIRQFFLSAGIRGITEAVAQRIVDRFNKDALQILEDQPEAFLSVSGIGRKRLRLLLRYWKRYKKISQIGFFLQKTGADPTLAGRIYGTYGSKSLSILVDNPYLLVFEARGIPFETADRIGRNLGIEPDSESRIVAGIEYLMQSIAGKGNTCFPKADFLEQLEGLLGLTADQVIPALNKTMEEHRLVEQSIHTEEGSEPFLWLKPYFDCEKGICTSLQRLMDEAVAGMPDPPASLSEGWTPEQKKAAEAVCRNKVLLISGGAGAGKLAVVEALVALGRSMNWQTEVITGAEVPLRWADPKRTAGSAGSESETDIPGRRLVVLHELQQFSVLELHDLLLALPSQTHLVMTGDGAQLPASGGANLFADLVVSGRFAALHLEASSAGNGVGSIWSVAQLVRQGDFPELLPAKDSCFLFVSEEDTEKIAGKIVGLVQQRLPRHYGFHPKNDIQVLTPMSRGIVGAHHLNDLLQEALNGNRKRFSQRRQSFLVGDKVLQRYNDPARGLRANQPGRVHHIDTGRHRLWVAFENKKVPYGWEELDHLELAYAVPVSHSHSLKAPCIIMPLHTTHYPMLYRNMLYAAVTRARRLVVLVGTREALWITIRNEARRKYTGLGAFLSGAILPKPI